MITTDRTLEQVKRAEMKIAAYVIEHNLPFQVTDHLSDIVGSSFPDSTIAKRVHSKHTKTRHIVKHVLANYFEDHLVETLKKTTFATIIDETTDISSKKVLALVVHFFLKEKNESKSNLLS